MRPLARLFGGHHACGDVDGQYGALGPDELDQLVGRGLSTGHVVRGQDGGRGNIRIGETGVVDDDLCSGRLQLLKRLYQSRRIGRAG